MSTGEIGFYIGESQIGLVKYKLTIESITYEETDELALKSQIPDVTNYRTKDDLSYKSTKKITFEKFSNYSNSLSEFRETSDFKLRITYLPDSSDYLLEFTFVKKA